MEIRKKIFVIIARMGIAFFCYFIYLSIFHLFYVCVCVCVWGGGADGFAALHGNM